MGDYALRKRAAAGDVLMDGFAEYDEYDALGLAALVRAGEVSPRALLEEAVARCERVNPQINAVVHRADDRAALLLRDLDLDAPFAGVPFLLKDLGHAWADVPMSCGSRYLRNYVPRQDSEFVRRLHRAGLITFGKTNTPEFGLVGSTEPAVFGPTRNPWELGLTAGGSSGGAAAAVAAGIVPMASASDGGGSIRIPASCCGLVGLKPSRGRNPSGPLLGEPWYGQVQDGVVSRSVRDTAAALDATHGPDAGAPYYAPAPERPFLAEVGRDPGRLRVVVCDEALCANALLDSESRAASDTVARWLQQLGHDIHYANPAIDRHALGAAFMARVVACTATEMDEAIKVMQRAPVRNDFELVTRAFANLGRSLSAADLTAANHTIERSVRTWGAFMRRFDVMITPTLARAQAPLGVFEVREKDYWTTQIASRVPLGPLARRLRVLEQLVTNNFHFVVSTMLANMTGEPSMSLPLLATTQGFPIGIMFTAPLYQEAALLRVAAQLERERPWRDRRPPVHA